MLSRTCDGNFPIESWRPDAFILSKHLFVAQLDTLKIYERVRFNVNIGLVHFCLKCYMRAKTLFQQAVNGALLG